MADRSPNFGFLRKHDPFLVELAERAERYCLTDPHACLANLRVLAEKLAQRAAAASGVYSGPEVAFADQLVALKSMGVLPPAAAEVFHAVRQLGNAAVHDGRAAPGDALSGLKLTRRLAVWFHRTFGRAPNFQPAEFIPPPAPRDATEHLRQELDELRTRLARAEDHGRTAAEQAQEVTRQREAAEAKAASLYGDLEAALALAEETEERLNAERGAFEQRLNAQQHAAEAMTPADRARLSTAAAASAGQLELDEWDTRRLIDAQLRAAGWEANSEQVRYERGIRPEKGKNRAIAEWPTASGPADYVLFAGLTAVAVVEAKRRSQDVPGSLGQSERYSRTIRLEAPSQAPGGPWEGFGVPFLYATNGRPYLKQIETKSGIWFRDARSATNLPRALADWHTPEGLLAMLKCDLGVADQQLAAVPPDYLPLRAYQQDAIRSVETAVAGGQRAILLAMATGTGKTRTALCLMYRLIKAQRFRRILFLVDRTALGEQAQDAFKDVRLEQHQTLADIYDVKQLGELIPEPDTKVQVATIQSVVRRVLDAEGGDSSLYPIDTYDCVIVDECHRGYSLDREMGEVDLHLRDEEDYISRYRRALEHFDAVRIGLTATPALHTTDIFGRPVYTYSYREAVLDGYLCDHEPPVRIVTKLAEEGMGWARGDQMQLFDPAAGNIDTVTLADEVHLDIDAFNKRVHTEAFNRVVCTELAKNIDPSEPGKTLVFCASDAHADLVVKLLTEAFEAQYGEVEADAVKKITGRSDRPLELIRKFKNERLPSVAVTVDLLTTGIDVEEIVNIVFIRRVRSRILYEQMLGRATRLRPDLYAEGDHKQLFRVYDAVDLYAILEPITSMKPVVQRPQIKFAQIVEEMGRAAEGGMPEGGPTREEALAKLRDEFRAKLQSRARTLSEAQADEIKRIGGLSPRELAEQLADVSLDDVVALLRGHPRIIEILDAKRDAPPQPTIISEHEDELRRVEAAFGAGQGPEDYLESFTQFVKEHINTIPALKLIAQRPRDLTRAQLREVLRELDDRGYSEIQIRAAHRLARNEDIAATIIGYIRHHALGLALTPYADRVDAAITTVLASRDWTPPQRRWLERIGAQLKNEVIVDREAFEHGAFRQNGGFAVINRSFGGELDTVLGEIADAVWAA